MLKDRETLILYTTAVCNLNCKYCFIDKNPALKVIDQYLDDSFMKTKDYYFNYAKEMFIQDKLKEIQIWGGEPFLAMHRAYDTIDKCINYFPNLKTIMASTNMVSDVFFDEFFGLINVLKQHPNRQFIFSLQLSLDGIKEINDRNRGEGVTDKFEKNFKILVQCMQELLPDNVEVRAHLKPTLDSSSIKILQSKEKIVEQFRYFETFNMVYLDINKKPNFKFSLPIPNTACPSPHNQQDGIRFANYCRMTRELERENRQQKIFKYYRSITSFIPRNHIDYSNVRLSEVCMGHCGNGKFAIGLLPNKMVSCCHNGFVDLIADYKKNVLNKSEHMDSVTIEKSLFKNERNTLIFKQGSKELENYEKQLEVFYQKDTTKMTNIASLIMLLGSYGQIDKKYANKEEAIRGAMFIMGATSYCVRDNLGTTGSIYMYPLGLIRLLLNGAREYIEQQ